MAVAKREYFTPAALLADDVEFFTDVTKYFSFFLKMVWYHCRAVDYLVLANQACEIPNLSILHFTFSKRIKEA